MLPEVEKLLVVQDRDRKILHIDREIANMPLEKEELLEKLHDDEAVVDRLKAENQENEIAMKNIELDVQTRRDSIVKLKTQQYETKKNEEFQAMGLEIQRYEGEISRLEDRELEFMEKGENIASRLEKAEAERDESKRDADEDIKNLEISAENLKKERAELEVNRKDYAAKVDADLLETYERLFKGKNGVAVVGLVNEVCQGCHVRVVKSTVVAVKAENEIAHCENCGRILYWWTDETDRVVDRYE